MFTVKIVKETEEFVLEARELTKEPNGILVQTETDTEFYGQNGQRMALDAPSRLQDRADNLIGGGAVAYVMNRFGATVASYRL